MPILGLEKYFGLNESEGESEGSSDGREVRSFNVMIARQINEARSRIFSPFPIIHFNSDSDSTPEAPRVFLRGAGASISNTGFHCDEGQVLLSDGVHKVQHKDSTEHQKDYRQSEDNKKLESLFLNHVHVNDEKQMKYLNLLENILNPIIKLMEETSPEFKKAYSGSSYCGGSFFDGLK